MRGGDGGRRKKGRMTRIKNEGKEKKRGQQRRKRGILRGRKVMCGIRGIWREWKKERGKE